MDHRPDETDERREARVAAMWPADRAERALRWDAAMAAGVASFWRAAGRPDLIAADAREVA